MILIWIYLHFNRRYLAILTGQIGWHTGMARVGEVQPAPIPAKTVPTAGFTCTHTMDLWVSVTPWVTHKPVWVCRNFLIFSWICLVFLCFLFFKHYIFLFSCIVPIVQYCSYIVK